MKRIAVVLPTRGLVFTEVEEAIEAARLRHEIIVFRSKDLPIPDSHNQLTEEALSNNFDYIWFIEEDTVPPKFALDHLLNADADIAFIDYAINGWACAPKGANGEILWCGLGCTLVKAEVFKKLQKPYFRTDKSLSLNDDTYFQWRDIPNKYGGQDIWFFSQARQAGYKLVQVPGECKHLKVDAYATPQVNDGRHVISQKPTITNMQTYEKPLTTGDVLDNNTTIGNDPTSI